MIFVICYLLFLLFVICYISFAICYLLLLLVFLFFVICYMIFFVIRFNICCMILLICFFLLFIIFHFSFAICYLLFASVTSPTTGTLMILLYWGSWSLRLSLAIWKRIRILCSMSSFYQFVAKKSRKGKKKNTNIFYPEYLLNRIIQCFLHDFVSKT